MRLEKCGGMVGKVSSPSPTKAIKAEEEDRQVWGVNEEIGWTGRTSDEDAPETGEDKVYELQSMDQNTIRDRTLVQLPVDISYIKHSN